MKRTLTRRVGASFSRFAAENWKGPGGMKWVGQILPLVAAALVGVAAVVVVSRIALTFDAIQSPGIRAVYGATILLIVVGIGGFAYWRTRRPLRTPPAVGRRPAPEDRLGRLFEKHGLDDAGEEASWSRRWASRARAGRPLTIALCGVARTGKTKLGESLRAALSARLDGREVRIVEAPSLGVDRAANLERLRSASGADWVLFVADQDLRDYEFAALRSLAERGAKLLVVINKADLLDATALKETESAIASKLQGLLAEGDIVSAAADPMPRPRLVTGDDGAQIEEEIERPVDVSRVVDRLLPRTEHPKRHV